MASVTVEEKIAQFVRIINADDVAVCEKKVIVNTLRKSIDLLPIYAEVVPVTVDLNSLWQEPKKAKAVKAPPAAPLSEAEEKKAKTPKIHHSFSAAERKLLFRNWENSPMTTVGISILCSRAVGDKKATIAKGTVHSIIKRHGAGMKSTGRKGPFAAYDPGDVARLARAYKIYWDGVSEKKSKDAIGKFNKKPAAAAAA